MNVCSMRIWDLSVSKWRGIWRLSAFWTRLIWCMIRVVDWSVVDSRIFILRIIREWFPSRTDWTRRTRSSRQERGDPKVLCLTVFFEWTEIDFVLLTRVQNKGGLLRQKLNYTKQLVKYWYKWWNGHWGWWDRKDRLWTRGRPFSLDEEQDRGD